MQSINVQFKFASRASSAKRRDVVERVQSFGTAKVKPLFPGEQDEELAAIQIVQNVDAKKATQVLQLLQDSDAIDYAETTPERQLID